MDNSEERDNLSRRRRRRILRRKGQKGVFKVEKRQRRRRARRKKILQKTVGAAMLAPLLPFKRPMKRALQRKGVDTSKMKFRTICAAFYNQFVSKKGNKKSSYEPIDEVEFYNDANFVLSIKEADLNSDSFALTTATISTVIAGIVNLFKKAKEKRAAAKGAGLTLQDAKEVLTETDLQLGKDAEDVERKLEAKAKEDTPVEKGKMKKYITYGVILGILILVLYYVSKSK